MRILNYIYTYIYMEKIYLKNNALEIHWNINIVI